MLCRISGNFSSYVGSYKGPWKLHWLRIVLGPVVFKQRPSQGITNKAPLSRPLASCDSRPPCLLWYSDGKIPGLAVVMPTARHTKKHCMFIKPIRFRFAQFWWDLVLCPSKMFIEVSETVENESEHSCNHAPSSEVETLGPAGCTWGCYQGGIVHIELNALDFFFTYVD